MADRNVFLTAEWNQLLMLNYAVDAAQLRPFVPAGTELDAFEGKPYISLVGFEFNRTRVLGWTVPFHQNFEEVNLRFYVRRGAKRGVVFIRELVPKYAVAVVARWVFNENYSCVLMSHRIEPGKVEYSWTLGASRCAMKIETEGESSVPAEGSLGQFITEHYWGYASQKGGGCLEYEVQHPPWQVWNSKGAGFSGDADALYGREFAQVLKREPDSAFLAEGSPVKVFKGRELPGG
jgi:uncharacterized protein YqjF (DUF2071 family)